MARRNRAVHATPALLLFGACLIASAGARVPAAAPLPDDLGDRLTILVPPPFRDAYPPPEGGVVLASRVPRPDLHMAAARGEIESALVTIRCDASIPDLTVALTDLIGPGGRIVADQWDRRWVLWWYAGQSDERASLTPEILAHDPHLLLHDHARRTSRGRDGWLVLRDADDLVPALLEPNRRRDIWLTVRVPEQAAPGPYHGHVLFLSAGREIARIRLTLTIHAFELLKPSLDYMLFYPVREQDERRPELVKTREAIELDVRDMLEHGCNHVIWYCNVETAMTLRRRLGITGPFYGCDGLPLPKRPEAEEKLRRGLAELAAADVPDVFIYGYDEPRPQHYEPSRRHTARAHELGAKVFTALALKHNDPWLESDAMIDHLDVAILYGPRTPVGLIERWHGAGKRVFLYADPFSHQPVPELHRRSYGLRAWLRGFDGVANWCYEMGQFQRDDPFANQRHDFCYAYRTASGPLPTLRWEAFREGVDDVRYLTTLRAALAAAPRGSTAAMRAEAWLDGLSERVDLDVMRSRAAGHIAALMGERRR